MEPICACRRLDPDSPYTFNTMKSTAHTLPFDADAMLAQAEQAAELLKALGNPQRLRILCLLVEGERSVGEINEYVPLSQSALSQHLALLREQALVETRREAQTIHYSIAEGPARSLLATLHEIYCTSRQSSRAKGGKC